MGARPGFRANARGPSTVRPAPFSPSDACEVSCRARSRRCPVAPRSGAIRPVQFGSPAPPSSGGFGDHGHSSNDRTHWNESDGRMSRCTKRAMCNSVTITNLFDLCAILTPGMQRVGEKGGSEAPAIEDRTREKNALNGGPAQAVVSDGFASRRETSAATAAVKLSVDSWPPRSRVRRGPKPRSRPTLRPRRRGP